MIYKTIQLEGADGISKLTLNRPERLNSFTAQMHEEVADALRNIRNSPTRVLILTGAGRGFCAGQDLSARTPRADGRSADLGESLEKYYSPLVQSLRALPIPVLAAVNGVAAGSGANVALACDLVIATRSASFVQSFAKLGLVPDAGGTWILPRLLGTARALGLALLAEKLSAEQAAQWGLIWKCVNDEDFIRVVDATARQLGSAPTAGLAAIKRAMYDSSHATFEQQLATEAQMQRRLGASLDYKEGVAAFMEKRVPRFVGR